MPNLPSLLPQFSSFLKSYQNIFAFKALLHLFSKIAWNAYLLLLCCSDNVDAFAINRWGLGTNSEFVVFCFRKITRLIENADWQQMR